MRCIIKCAVILINLLLSQTGNSMLLMNPVKDRIDDQFYEFKEAGIFQESTPSGWRIISGSISENDSDQVRINGEWYYYGSDIQSKDGIPIWLRSSSSQEGSFYTLFNVVYYFIPKVYTIEFQKFIENPSEYFVRWNFDFTDEIEEYHIYHRNAFAKQEHEVKKIDSGKLDSDYYTTITDNPGTPKDGPSAQYRIKKKHLSMDVIKEIYIEGIDDSGKKRASSEKRYVMKMNDTSIYSSRDTCIELSIQEFNYRGASFSVKDKDFTYDDLKHRLEYFQQYIHIECSEDAVKFTFNYFMIPTNKLLSERKKFYLYAMGEKFYEKNYKQGWKPNEEELWDILRIFIITNTNIRNNTNKNNFNGALNETALVPNSDFVLFVPKPFPTCKE
ncbi:MAG: hypothetical protein HQ521_12275 [Bacteroidetes bacterium]|nr:hypothetical protein [Bacteroidota bacterium]